MVAPVITVNVNVAVITVNVNVVVITVNVNVVVILTGQFLGITSLKCERLPQKSLVGRSSKTFGDLFG